MARRTLYLPALIVAAVFMGCAPAVLAVSGKAKAAFPGKNGKIAYVRNDGNDYEIYAIDGGGGDKTQLTNDNTGNYAPSYSPAGKKIVINDQDGSITIEDENSNKWKMDSSGITVEAAGTLTLKGGSEVKIEAPSVSINGSGTTEIKGGVVNIN